MVPTVGKHSLGFKSFCLLKTICQVTVIMLLRIKKIDSIVYFLYFIGYGKLDRFKYEF